MTASWRLGTNAVGRVALLPEKNPDAIYAGISPPPPFPLRDSLFPPKTAKRPNRIHVCYNGNPATTAFHFRQRGQLLLCCVRPISRLPIKKAAGHPPRGLSLLKKSRCPTGTIGGHRSSAVSTYTPQRLGSRSSTQNWYRHPVKRVHTSPAARTLLVGKPKFQSAIHRGMLSLSQFLP